MRAIQKNGGSILMCVLEILVGVLLLVDPTGFTSAIIIAAGAALILYGVICIVRYFRADAAEGALRQSLFKGLLLLLGGLFCVLRSRWFVDTFPLLTILYGIGLLISGIGKIQWMADMIRFGRKRWYLPAISAVLSLIFAAIILCAPTALWSFLGIVLIVEAVFDIVAIALGGKHKGSDDDIIDV
ncbi:MAG: DUF308 domain-containing protein [Faecousia sp.]